MEVLHQPAQVAEVGAEFLGRDGGIFEAFPVQRFAGDMRSHAQTGLADVPDALSLAWVGEQAHIRRSRGALKRLHQITRLRFGFSGSVGAELNHQPATTFG